MARYWRIRALQTPSNDLALSALALSDGTTDYSTATLTGSLTPTFGVDWDLGSDIAITSIKLTSITQPDFPTSLFCESSPDGTTWSVAGLLETITYPGDAALATVVLNDPYTVQTILLLRGDGTLTDSSFSPKSLTALGNAQVSSVQSKFGGSSILLDGTGDYLSVTTKSDFAFGTGDFTVEGWFYHSVVNQYSIALDIGTFGGGNSAAFMVSDNGAARIYSGGSFGAKTTTPGTWQHIAWVRLNGVLTIYVAGVGSTPVSFPNDLTSISTVTVGALGSGAQYAYAGYIDDLRVTKGAARYTANFTPPVAALPGPSTGVSQPTPVSVFAPGGVVSIGDEGTWPVGGVSPVTSGVATTDMYDGGVYKVSGNVAEKSSPTNVPVARRVMLLEDRSHRIVRETWSDNAGDYEFLNVKGDAQYTVIAYDHRYAYRAVIADNLTPELMT